MDLKIQFCQTLQPTCLASIEMGLDKDVHQRFIISVDVTHIDMQVVPLLHTPKVHTHEFSIGYMVSTLSRDELLAVECHRMSTLQQLSTTATTEASVVTSNG